MMTKHDLRSDLRLLELGLAELGYLLDDVRRSQFETYIKEIHLFNGTYRLVGAEGREFIIKHLLDSLGALPIFESLVKHLGPSVRICDVGSGAGLPGIPLAIMLSEVPFVLVERSGRRAGFLRNALALCNLHERVEVFERDLSEVDDCFGIVTFRAFHPLGDIVRPISRIVAEGAFICAYKGRKEAIEEELSAAGIPLQGGEEASWTVRMEELRIPFLDASRTLCIMQKIR